MDKTKPASKNVTEVGLMYLCTKGNITIDMKMGQVRLKLEKADGTVCNYMGEYLGQLVITALKDLAPARKLS